MKPSPFRSTKRSLCAAETLTSPPSAPTRGAAASSSDRSPCVVTAELTLSRGAKRGSFVTTLITPPIASLP